MSIFPSESVRNLQFDQIKRMKRSVASETLVIREKKRLADRLPSTVECWI